MLVVQEFSESIHCYIKNLFHFICNFPENLRRSLKNNKVNNFGNLLIFILIYLKVNSILRVRSSFKILSISLQIFTLTSKNIFLCFKIFVYNKLEHIYYINYGLVGFL